MKAERVTGRVIAIDRIRCDGRGVCAELVPELISLDDWGYPIVTATAVPVGMTRRVGAAVDLCPVLALRMKRVARPQTG